MTGPQDLSSKEGPPSAPGRADDLTPSSDIQPEVPVQSEPLNYAPPEPVRVPPALLFLGGVIAAGCGAFLLGYVGLVLVYNDHHWGMPIGIGWFCLLVIAVPTLIGEVRSCRRSWFLLGFLTGVGIMALAEGTCYALVAGVS